MSGHPFSELARSAVEWFVRTGAHLQLPEPLPTDFTAQAAAFVSIHRKDGSLRGCIGSIYPLEENLAREIIRNAIAAACNDPRFPAVTGDELPDLEFSVDVLGHLEVIDSVALLDPRRYGLVVEKGWRRGLLLPDLRGVDSADLQLRYALEKAGINAYEDFRMLRFEVQRFH